MTLLIRLQEEDEGIISQTRRRRNIRNRLGLPMLPFYQEQARNLIIQQFPYERFLPERTPPTRVCNCHGLTFLNRRARLTEEEEIQKILKDDEYREIPLTDIASGDVILYYEETGEISHTGIVMRLEKGVAVMPYILSKWGDAGEYLHPYNQCPYWKSELLARFFREGQSNG